MSPLLKKDSTDINNPNLINDVLENPRTLFVADLDRDGDQDVLTGTRSGANPTEFIVWGENQTILSIPDVSPIDIALYPNPVLDLLFLEMVGASPVIRMYLYTIDGRNIIRSLSGESTITMSDLVSGVYFLTLHTSEGSVTKKVVKD